jgi:hypothetical protein
MATDQFLHSTRKSSDNDLSAQAERIIRIMLHHAPRANNVIVSHSTELDRTAVKHCLKALGIPEAQYPYDVRHGSLGWALGIPLTTTQYGDDYYSYD